jgi:hypothetical protein
MYKAKRIRAIKFFIRCWGRNCRADQELPRAMKTDGFLCKGCNRALVYRAHPSEGVISEVVFAGQVSVVTYGAANAPRRARTRR